MSLWGHATFATQQCGTLSALELYSYAHTHLTTYRHTQKVVLGLFQILRVENAFKWIQQENLKEKSCL